MSVLDTFGFVLGTAFASGLNLYATIAVVGLLERFGTTHSPTSLAILANPVVIAVALALYIVEFVADKIPYVDHLWDAPHTFIRPFGAVMLAYGATAAIPQEWRVVAALIAGSISLTSHGTKASARVAINTSPEPFSNSIASAAEDAIAIFLTWIATAHPILSAVLVIFLVGLCLFVLVKLVDVLRKISRRFTRRKPAPLC